MVAEFEAETADVPEELLRQEAGRFYDVFVCPLPNSLEPIVRTMYSKEQFEELVAKAWMHSVQAQALVSLHS